MTRVADAAGGGGGLYYSWSEFGPEKFTWAQADAGCRRRGQQLVSITDAAKNAEIVRQIESNSEQCRQLAVAGLSQ